LLLQKDFFFYFCIRFFSLQANKAEECNEDKKRMRQEEMEENG